MRGVFMNSMSSKKGFTTANRHGGYSNSDKFRFIAKLRGNTRAYCPKCERPVQLISDSKAEDIFRSELPDLLSLATRGVLHRLHNSRGTLMFCGDSLFQCFSDRPTQLLTNPNAERILADADRLDTHPITPDLETRS
jgi:hypothetical protein